MAGPIGRYYADKSGILQAKFGEFINCVVG